MVVNEAVVDFARLAAAAVFYLAELGNVGLAGATQGGVQPPVGLPGGGNSSNRASSAINEHNCGCLGGGRYLQRASSYTRLAFCRVAEAALLPKLMQQEAQPHTCMGRGGRFVRGVQGGMACCRCLLLGMLLLLCCFCCCCCCSQCSRRCCRQSPQCPLTSSAA
jgi:hypothetical protein